MSATNSIVHVIDDDQSFLTSLARLLRVSGYRVNAYSSADEFLQQCPFDVSGCVVVDLQMPDMNGMELQEILAKRDDPLPVVFLTGQGDIPSSVKAMRRGAEDFLTKLAPKEELLAVVERALRRDAAERKERILKREMKSRFDQLTEREHEVLVHVLEGKLNKQIAADLGIAERSVKRHRTALMQKMQVQSVAELSHLAHVAGLVSSHEVPPGGFISPSEQSTSPRP